MLGLFLEVCCGWVVASSGFVPPPVVNHRLAQQLPVASHRLPLQLLVAYLWLALQLPAATLWLELQQPVASLCLWPAVQLVLWKKKTLTNICKAYENDTIFVPRSSNMTWYKKKKNNWHYMGNILMMAATRWMPVTHLHYFSHFMHYYCVPRKWNAAEKKRMLLSHHSQGAHFDVHMQIHVYVHKHALSFILFQLHATPLPTINYSHILNRHWLHV